MVLPKNFGKYDVVGVLGAGAMGTVYDCVDPVIGRRVAIKTILKHSLDASEAKELLDRFKQEAQAAGRLNHPGVCAIYDYGETDYVAYIAMEYISGKELKKYFDEGDKFDLKEIVRVMTEILDALDHAHRNKVVHRDIKPANIMITEDGRVKVADFGVAKIESSMLTQVGTKVGTPAYMSPEQHKGLVVDGRSDLFSCGVILYQFLTGARPFAGGSSTVAQEILTRTPTPPSEINPSLTPVWDSIAKKALAKRRDERYLTARDFIDALAQGLADAPSAVGVPYQTATSAASDTLNTAARGGATGNTDKAERTNLAMESELEFWKEIKDSDIEEDFAAFVESFPDGRFAHIAKRRLDKLRTASARSQSDQEAQRPALAEMAPTPVAPAQAPGEADQDQTLVSSHSHPVVGAASQRKPMDVEARAPATARPAPDTDADATLVQSKFAEAKVEADADATLVQQLGGTGAGASDAVAAPDAGDADAIDFDLSEGVSAAPAVAAPTSPSVAAPATPTSSSTPPAAPAALPATLPATVTAKAASPSPPSDSAITPPSTQATPQAAADIAPASPTASPSMVSSVAPRVSMPAAPSAAAVAPAAAKTVTAPPQPVGGPSPAIAPATTPTTSPATSPATTAPTTATAPAKAESPLAVSAAPPVVPKLQPVPTEEPQPVRQPTKSAVPMMAGVAVALVAAGIGWFMLGSNTAPSSKSPETASREANSGQSQARAERSLPSPATEKSVPGPSKGADTNATPETKKANDAAEQKKAEQGALKLAEEKAAAKLAADRAASDKAGAAKLATDKAAADKLAAEKAASDKRAAERAATDTLAADKVAADKLAADKAAADKLAADKAAADKLAAEKAAADKLASEKAAAATVASAGSIADRIAAASAPAELYKRAVALRSEGKASQAVALLRQASSQGHGPSSRLLAIIFTDGSGDVRPNFREVERYKALAEKQGER